MNYSSPLLFLQYAISSRSFSSGASQLATTDSREIISPPFVLQQFLYGAFNESGP
jgi:hypothetical protein